MIKRKSIDVLIKYIISKYSELIQENKSIGGEKRVTRHTTQAMSCYVENAIALMINEELKEKKYNIVVEPQLSVGLRNTRKPDIIIYDDDRIIHGIVEVKSQLGYLKKGDGTKHRIKINEIKNASKNNKLKFNDQFYTIDDNCIDLLVVLMRSNSHKSIEYLEREVKKNKINYYLLYTGGISDVWYDKYPYEKINDDNVCGMYAFIDKIKQIGQK